MALFLAHEIQFTLTVIKLPSFAKQSLNYLQKKPILLL